MNHIGIYIANEADEIDVIKHILKNKFLKEFVDLSVLNGELYSTLTLEQYIDEEVKHEKYTLTGSKNKSLLNMSSGQQRKALLNYIITKDPQYLVLDDIFGSIDIEAQQYTIETLSKIASTTLLIQLFHRKADILNEIETVIEVDKNNKIINTQSSKEFKKTHLNHTHVKAASLPHLFGEHNLTIDPIIELKDISVHYDGLHVLKNVSWTIKAGEFWQLKGPNGSGKSTLLSMIIGDNPKAYGQNMLLFGIKKGSGETVWDIKKNIGYFTPAMIQQFKHNDTVENMLISGLVDSVGLYGKPTNLQRQIAHSWIELMGPTFNNKKFNQLSYGQQRILMVTRAMIKHPSLLILDEPTVGLDDENAELFISMVKAIAQPKKVSIIYVSHRHEPELQPDKIFTLTPSNEGSKGVIL